MPVEMVSLPLDGPVTELITDRRTGRTWAAKVTPFEIAPTVVTAAQWGGTGDLPQVGVTWLDALAFCNELSAREGLTPAYGLDGDVTWDRTADGFRLPTDAEWQVACRAASPDPRPGDLDRAGWYVGNAGGEPHPVARLEPNAWGLFDMLGGVWEWCWDACDEGAHRIIRGGGWADPAWSCRPGVRRRTSPDATQADLGFRIARTAA